MKKRILMCGLMMLFSMGTVTTVYAAEADKTVTLTDDNTIVYEDNKSDIGTAFEGMAPGDVRTVTICVKNDSDHAASFFISQETIKFLEEKETASGGAYTYDVKVGKENDATAVSLLDAVAGGYGADMTADKDGLASITELESYQYLAEVGSGEYTNVYVTLAIDGEGFDSTDAVNYENATGQLEFNFRAYYEDREPVVIKEMVKEKRPDNIITTIEDKIVPIVTYVQTGDTFSVMPIICLMMAGMALILFALKKGKAESK